MGEYLIFIGERIQKGNPKLSWEEIMEILTRNSIDRHRQICGLDIDIYLMYEERHNG